MSNGNVLEMNLPPATPLPKRQQDAFDFITGFFASNKYAPSSKEIADALGISKPAAAQKLRALERAGKIKTTPNVARSIVILA